MTPTNGQNLVNVMRKHDDDSSQAEPSTGNTVGAAVAGGLLALGGFALKRLAQRYSAEDDHSLQVRQLTPPYAPGRQRNPMFEQLDAAIDNLTDTVNARQAPRVTPRLPSMGEETQSTSNLPISEDAYQAFCTMWAFFRWGEMPNDAPGLAPGVERNFSVRRNLTTAWPLLDDETKAWIEATPRIWPVIQALWRQAPRQEWELKKRRDFFEPQFAWFEERWAAPIKKPGRVRPLKVPTPPQE